MNWERKKGWGCGTIVLLMIAAAALAGGALFVLNQYVVILPRDVAIPAATPLPKPRVATGFAAPVKPSATPVPVATATPTPAIDLADLESRMQEWPDEVTLAADTTFPGNIVAPAGTRVKLISAGEEVVVEYQGEQAQILADQTDLVMRVQVHRDQIASERESQKKLAEKAALKNKTVLDAQEKEIERIYGKAPSHNDTYFAAKTFLLQIIKTPDSLQIVNLSETALANYNNGKRWGAKVQFRYKNDKGEPILETGTVYMDGDKVIDYIKGQ